MKNIKGFIFDMDGVIFDTERVYLDIWTNVFKKYGYEMEKDVYISVMGRGRKIVKEVFINHFGQDLPIEEMYVEKDNLLFEVINRGEVPIKEGAIEILDFLKEHNYKIALATSAKMDRLKKQLTLANIYDKFDVIVCGDDVNKTKPDPEIYIKAATYLNLQCEDCVVIEDSPAGIRGAYNGNMIPFHVEDLKEADEEMKRLSYRCFKNLNEIKEYINGIIR